jgi:hypothetical protein
VPQLSSGIFLVFPELIKHILSDAPYGSFPLFKVPISVCAGKLSYTTPAVFDGHRLQRQPKVFVIFLAGNAARV